MTRWSHSLTAADYVAGLTAIAPRVTPVQRRLLTEQYYAPGRQVTAPQLARLAEVAGGYSVINAHYGRLGRLFCNQTGERPDVRQSGPNRGKERLWATWSAGWSGPEGFVWQMLPEVADALEQLGWVQPGQSSTTPAVAPTVTDVSVAEGRELVRLHRTRERSRGLVARKKQAVLSVSGQLLCEVCDFDFAASYGPRGDGFAECHHTHPISQSAPERRTRLSELAVVCANCHRMLHRRPWVSVMELRALVLSRRGG